MTVNMSQCGCACVCILQSGPWPTLKSSHHSDPQGLQISSLCIYVCILKSVPYKKSHSINLFLPAHTPALSRVKWRRYHFWCMHICEGCRPTKVTHHFLSYPIFSTRRLTQKCHRLLLFLFLLSLFLSLINVNKVWLECNPSANWQQNKQELLKCSSDSPDNHQMNVKNHTKHCSEGSNPWLPSCLLFVVPEP